MSGINSDYLELFGYFIHKNKWKLKKCNCRTLQPINSVLGNKGNFIKQRDLLFNLNEQHLLVYSSIFTRNHQSTIMWLQQWIHHPDSRHVIHKQYIVRLHCLLQMMQRRIIDSLQGGRTSSLISLLRRKMAVELNHRLSVPFSSLMYCCQCWRLLDRRS